MTPRVTQHPVDGASGDRGSAAVPTAGPAQSQDHQACQSRTIATPGRRRRCRPPRRGRARWPPSSTTSRHSRRVGAGVRHHRGVELLRRRRATPATGRTARPSAPRATAWRRPRRIRPARLAGCAAPVDRAGGAPSAATGCAAGERRGSGRREGRSACGVGSAADRGSGRRRPRPPRGAQRQSSTRPEAGTMKLVVTGMSGRAARSMSRSAR